jgi:hypothetical protein
MLQCNPACRNAKNTARIGMLGGQLPTARRKVSFIA